MSQQQDSKTDAVARVIAQELLKRRALLDGNTGLTSLSITVYLQEQPGDPVRSIAIEEHTQLKRKRTQ